MFDDFKPLFPHLKPLKMKFFFGLLAGLVYGVASGAGLPFLSKTALPLIFQDEEKLEDVPEWFLEGVEQIFGSDPDKLLLASCVFIPVVFVLRGLSGYFSSYWMNEVGMCSIESFRREVFSRLMGLPMMFFGKKASGDLLSRVIGDTGALQGAVTRTAGDFVKQPIVLVSALAFLITEAIDKQGVFFALIGGISIPLLVFPIRILGKRLKRRGARLQAKAGEMSGMVSEAIQNPLEVRAYNLQERMTGTFSGLAGEWRKLELKMVRYRQTLGPLVEVVAAVGFTLSLYLGAQKGMELENFLGIAMALFLSYEPVKKLGALHGVLEQAKASINRVKDILDAEDSLPEPVNPAPAPGARGEVVFENVRFGYGDEEVLKGVSVEIGAGETIALVGESGGGKTTFANLIPRFYDVSSGVVKVDGLDVREFAKAELRERIAIVPQMPVLFRGTIRENILVGRPGASNEEVEEAAKKAFAHDFILKQEKGYETPVSEKGSSLSGGQRQRIAIARAFLKDAPILIMDEATSALDAESEAKVQAALEGLAQGRTTLMISHRESSREMAERVLEFEKGVVRWAESG